MNWYGEYAKGAEEISSKLARPDTNNRDIVASYLRTQEERDNYMAGNNIDWFDVVMRDSPIIQNYDLSYSGSTNRVNYYISGSYTGEEGVIINDQWERLNFTSKVDGKITDWMSPVMYSMTCLPPIIRTWLKTQRIYGRSSLTNRA